MLNKIGNVELQNNIFLAPLAGITDRAFRTVCRRFGAGFVYSEMISAKGVHYKGNNSIELGVLSPEEMPAAIQIFGSEPEIMGESAKVFENMGAAVIDINMGCPVPKVTSNKEGSALMKDITLAAKIIETVSKSVSIPVTVKMRRGFNTGNETCVQLAKAAEESGAKAVTVHGRYRDEYYSGISDWNCIKRVKENVNIPVIASGDIKNRSDMLKCIELTGCDGVMIGRGALGNPWIFKELQGQDVIVDGKEKFRVISEHMELVLAYKGEYTAVREMRKHISWYIKGWPDAAAIRNKVVSMTDSKKIMEYIGQVLL